MKEEINGIMDTNKIIKRIKNINTVYIYIVLSLLAGVVVIHMFTGQ